MKLLLLCFTISIFTIAFAQPGQYIPITKTYDGLTVLGNGDSSFMIEAYIDLMCPDCSAAYPKLMGAIQSLKLDQNKDFRLIFHIFPLPFHHNAFLSAVGEKYIQDTYDVQSAHNYIKLMFDQQQQFWDINTLNTTEQGIMDKFANIVSQNFSGQIEYNDFITALTYGNNYFIEAANSWRLGCTRGVADTPTFFVNGVRLDAASGGDASFSQEDWVNFLVQFFPQSENTKKMNTVEGLLLKQTTI